MEQIGKAPGTLFSINAETGFRGVCKDMARDKFQATLCYEGEKHYCGSHPDAASAARAFDAKARELGIAEEELNFPGDLRPAPVSECEAQELEWLGMVEECRYEASDTLMYRAVITMGLIRRRMATPWDIDKERIYAIANRERKTLEALLAPKGFDLGQLREAADRHAAKRRRTS